jgi:Flp pilus assembly protein TadG
MAQEAYRMPRELLKTGGAKIAARCRGLFGRFRKDRDGATAVEFAMVSVPFFGLLFAIFETAFVFFATEGLEAAVADASRQILTGQAQIGAISTATAFRDTLICPSPPSTRKRILPSFIDCSKLKIDVRLATTFATADLTKGFYMTPGTMKYCPGAPGDIVIVRVVYPMPVYLSVIAGMTTGSVHKVTTGLENDGSGTLAHVLMGTSVFRTEPFTGFGGYLGSC